LQIRIYVYKLKLELDYGSGGGGDVILEFTAIITNYILFRLGYTHASQANYLKGGQLFLYIISAFFLGGGRGTRIPKHFLNLTAGSKKF
jgi:hypothetical protein